MFDVEKVRGQFPALQEPFNGRPAIFFDNPGGTQVHESVVGAMVDYMTRRNSNTHGLFETSRRTDAVIEAAHRAVADLLGCDADEVVFGNNMTSLTFHVSRSLARALGPGDEVVVTRLDHDANVMPWVLAAEERGARVRWADVDVESGTLDMEDVQRQITERTKLVAVGYASNATGTINDVDTIIGWAGRGGGADVCGRGPVCAARIDRRAGSWGAISWRARRTSFSGHTAGSYTVSGNIWSGWRLTECVRPGTCRQTSGRRVRRIMKGWRA